MTTEEILAQLRTPGNRVPREALDEVIQRREEFVPILIAEIEKATELAENFDPRDGLAFFALYLLAELRETRALEPILAWFVLDKKAGESLFGDILGKDAAAMLAVLAHDNPGRLQDYAIQDGLSSWVRSLTFDALVRQVLWGYQPREPLVEYFSGLFKTDALLNDDIAWTMLINACMDLHPRELLDDIRGIYERDLVDLFAVGDFDDVEREATIDLETHLRQGALQYPPITDTAEAISWWACFERPRPLSGSLGGRALSPLPDDSDFFEEEPGVTIRHEQPKIGRNDLCPCGSGKKYKKCCMPVGG